MTPESERSGRCIGASRRLAQVFKRVELRDPGLAKELNGLDPFEDRSEMEMLVKDAELAKATEKAVLGAIESAAKACRNDY